MTDRTKGHSSAEARCVCLNLRKSARAVTQFYDGTLAPSGLRVTQFSVLSMAAGWGPMPMSALAEHLVMDRTTLSRNLRPLERRGLIQVEPGADRRERLISITPAGLTALGAALPLWQEAQSRMVEGLGKDGWGDMLEHLGKTVGIAHPG